jgi:disulfide bond formation protein DsbB
LKIGRPLFAFIFLACLALLGFGLYLQHIENLEPCPLCILQRYAFLAVGFIALLAALHNPARTGKRVYGALLALFAITGAAIAGRQSWLQHYPPVIADCGPDLEYMIESFPLSKALPMIFKGSGDCAEVVWRFLGLSIPEWALVFFILFGLIAVYLVSRKAP